MKTVDSREKRIEKLVEAIRGLVLGRSNAAGSVTLRTNETTTTVTSEAIAAGCFPQLTPASSAAAAELAVYVSSVAKGSFVITHPSAATAGRTWHWHAVGG